MFHKQVKLKKKTKKKKLKEYKIIQTPCNISTNVKLRFLLKD